MDQLKYKEKQEGNNKLLYSKKKQVSFRNACFSLVFRYKKQVENCIPKARIFEDLASS